MESFSVGESQPDMIGRHGVFFLLTLGSRYSRGVLGGEGGSRNWNVLESMMLELKREVRYVRMSCTREGKGSWRMGV